MPCPQNIRMFVWRLKHNSLALCINLANRGVKLDSTKCFFCGRMDEDGAHLFVKCKTVKEQERVAILTMWWQWWQNRNKVREGELPLSAEEIVRRTKSYSLEYAEFFGKDVKAKSNTRWRPPPDDIIKLNVDGAFNAGDARAGWGVVARNSHGNILHADSKLIEEALDFACADSSPYAPVIEDLKLQMKMWFSFSKVRACRREANNVAHELAKIGQCCFNSKTLYWESDVPPIVAGCALGDMPTHT
ncbi:uncharacterized protein [Aegilops tauschii subsp. strangulata]|uniref:uncharacterized protein n=1 Tax=Aegilops tauschii subsp. strangulata TaxID=200361 RepID=UPI003CC84B6F